MGAEQLALLLGSLVKTMLEYKTARDKALAAGNVSNADGSVKTDAQLIELFRQDAAQMRDEAQRVLDKYAHGFERTGDDPPPPPPVPPAREDPGR